MTLWAIKGRFLAEQPLVDWREQLAARLGYRPRRLGNWAEWALYGARLCLDRAQEETLPNTAILRVASSRGPANTTFSALTDLPNGLPLPYSFLQCQPGQMLAAIGTALRWSGDACFTASRDPLACAALACQQSTAAGILLGWVEEEPNPCSFWLRLQPEPSSAMTDLLPQGQQWSCLCAPTTSHWLHTPTGLQAMTHPAGATLRAAN